jgi:hypothetical protein
MRMQTSPPVDDRPVRPVHQRREARLLSLFRTHNQQVCVVSQNAQQD